MVAPSYYLACRIFDDSGLVTGAVPEGGEGADLEFLEGKLEEAERDQNVKVSGYIYVIAAYFLPPLRRQLRGACWRMSSPRDTEHLEASFNQSSVVKAEVIFLLLFDL